MVVLETTQLRNIGIVAHIDAGKTSLTERILYYTGENYKIGEVHEGTATMDWMQQEQERGITIVAAATTCYWQSQGKKYQINIIDTPGHVDFTAEVERSVRILDGVIVVICGVSGIQPQTETVWHQIEKFNIPRIIFVNKMDRTGVDYDRVIEDVRNILKTQPIKINFPLEQEKHFRGIIDIVEGKGVVFDDATYGEKQENVTLSKENSEKLLKEKNILLDKLSWFENSIIEKMLDDKEIETEEINTTIKKYCLKNAVVPVCCGSALKNKGIQQVLDAVSSFLPSPLETKKPEIMGEDKQPKEISSKKKIELLGMVFKVQVDKYGVLCYLRIYEGTLYSGKQYFNSTKKKKVNIMKVFRMHSNKKEEIKEAVVGEIVAFQCDGNVATGDTICPKGESTVLENINFPEPVVSAAVIPRAASDFQKLEKILKTLVLEDPTIHYRKDKETGQSIISGMGELHIEVIADRLARDFSLNVKIGKPQVAYRETITEKIVINENFSKNIDGQNINFVCKMELFPLSEGQNTVDIIDNTLDKKINEILLKNILNTLASGVIAGYPTIQVGVVVKEISWSTTKSLPELCISFVANMVRKGLLQGKAVLLSPIMAVTITTPQQFTGSIVSNINSKKGKILSILDNGIEKNIVKSNIELASMFGYMTELRSLTQGRANFSVEFDYFKQIC